MASWWPIFRIISETIDGTDDHYKKLFRCLGSHKIVSAFESMFRAALEARHQGRTEARLKLRFRRLALDEFELVRSNQKAGRQHVLLEIQGMLRDI